MKLFDYQEKALALTSDKDNSAFYYDMGLGKTFIGSERLRLYGERVNIIVCQKSKIKDWCEHFKEHYTDYAVFDLTDKKDMQTFMIYPIYKCIGIINYELAYRREELRQLKDFTMMLDESSMIKNETAKRTKFILSLKPSHTILLSGTPTDGKYEFLYSQLRLLGWKITKTAYYNRYIKTELRSYGGPMFRVVTGYKNVSELKAKLKEYGAVFAKAEEVIKLPEKKFIKEYSTVSSDYKKFMKDRVIKIDDKELTGDSTLSKRLYARMLCSAYSKDKISRLIDLVNSTSDRVIIFYNFNTELEALRKVLFDRPISIVNGQVKDLKAYENNDNSVTLIQYQAGAMGLNLQKANRIIYFSLPERSELFEQSKARICRIGQEKQCTYNPVYVLFNVEMEEETYNRIRTGNKRCFNGYAGRQAERG